MKDGTHEGKSAWDPGKSQWGMILAYFFGLIMLRSVSSVLGAIINSFVTMTQEGEVGREERKK